MQQEDIQGIYLNHNQDNKRKYAFPCRVTDMWNAVPESVKCETVKKFEKKLDQFLSNSEQMYNYRAHIIHHTYPQCQPSVRICREGGQGGYRSLDSCQVIKFCWCSLNMLREILQLDREESIQHDIHPTCYQLVMDDY